MQQGKAEPNQGKLQVFGFRGRVVRLRVEACPVIAPGTAGQLHGWNRRGSQFGQGGLAQDGVAGGELCLQAPLKNRGSPGVAVGHRAAEDGRGVPPGPYGRPERGLGLLQLTGLLPRPGDPLVHAREGSGRKRCLPQQQPGQLKFAKRLLAEGGYVIGKVAHGLEEKPARQKVPQAPLCLEGNTATRGHHERQQQMDRDPPRDRSEHHENPVCHVRQAVPGRHGGGRRLPEDCRRMQPAIKHADFHGNAEPRRGGPAPDHCHADRDTERRRKDQRKQIDETASRIRHDPLQR